MKGFFLAHQTEIFWSLITCNIIILLSFVIHKTIKRRGHINNFVEARTLLITKYVSVLLTILGVGALIFIWGVHFKDLRLLFSSIFTIIRDCTFRAMVNS